MMPSVGRRRKSNLDLPPRVYIKFGAYYFVHLDGKWQRLAKVGDEKEMRRCWAVLTDPDGGSNNTSALIDDYLVSYAKKHKAERTYTGNLNEAEYLKDFFGDMRPHEIMPRDVGHYLDLNREQRPVRANREKALLSHIFSWAMRHQVWGTMVTFNPCKGVHRNPETKRVRIVEDYEFAGVYRLANKNVQRIMDLVYRSLQRPSDLLKIGPRNIFSRKVNGADCKILKIKQSKRGNEVEIIVTPDIEQAIAPTTNVIFPTFIHTEDGAAYTYTGIRSMFTRALEKYRSDVEKKTGTKPPPFGIYDLKGKGATDMFRAGMQLQVIQVLCGHDSITTTEIYIKSLLLDPVMPNQHVMEK
jgi:integrase